MATESPIRMPEASRKWPNHKETASFVTPTANMAAEELVLLRKSPIVHGNGKDTVPNRSGSAPPNMEGSFLAIDNLLSQQSFSMNSSLPSLNGAADRSYLAYYRANVNLNPRISSARISRENQHLMHHIGALSTHKEESEDDCSPQQSPDGILDQTNRFWAGHNAAHLAGQQHNLVDFIQ
ncbi:pumilio homolog 5-like, partial [Carica papaya]|uniref:pumilio homolog 5-like n=1 Tax=Carica papaya TaxID=3649 RepID=UPI000B8C6F21